MTVPKKAVAVAAGVALAVAAAALAPAVAAQGPGGKADPDVLVVEDVRIDWIEKSRVAALREGVIDTMELESGMPVAKGKPIGYLKSDMARLTVAKAKLAADSVAPRAKAQAEEELSLATLGINKRLNDKMKGAVSFEEQKKAEAQYKVALAMVAEADEKVKLDQAELDLAERTLVEHTITAPFDGVVIDRLKNPGESVRAGDPVVILGNVDRLRSWGYVPLEYAYRVKVGQLVDFQPRISDGKQAPLPIEQRKYRGKITFVDPQIQAEGERAVRIYADFANKFDTRDAELRPGLKGTLTIYLNSGEGNETPPAVGAKTGGNGLER